MNKLDSENVAAILASGGYTVVGDLHEADVILLNTCAVRDNAEQRIHGRIGELSSLRRGKPELLFGIIGCMAQRLGEQLIPRFNRGIALVAKGKAAKCLKLKLHLLSSTSPTALFTDFRIKCGAVFFFHRLSTFFTNR
jgi:tRNA-2-methylthio-N6-dimethylallyladenosine synthase